MFGGGDAPALSVADLPAVLSTLNAALSQAAEVRKPAEDTLVLLEGRAGFCSCLMEIISAQEHDHSARWLAATQLKNCLQRHWRSRPGQGGISPEEKTHVRATISALIPQDDNQIALQVALIYAKIARNDYPREWPSLFHDLLANLSTAQQLSTTAQQLTVRRVYLVLHHIVKELSSKRLFADQRNFAEVCNLLFEHVWGQWCADSQLLVSGVPSGLDGTTSSQQLLVTFERWMLLLKIVYRLVLFGHTSDAKSLQPVQAVSVCAPAMVQVLQQLIAMQPASQLPSQQQAGQHAAVVAQHQQQPARRQLVAMLDRGILKLIKVHTHIVRTHPWSFHASGALLTMLTLCCECVVEPRAPTPSNSNPTPSERKLITCMTFVKEVVDCGAYKGKTAGGRTADAANAQDAPVAQLAGQAQATLSQFWTPERLTGLCTALVQHLSLTQRDLEEWQANPEEYFHTCDDSAWQERVNLCAETLLLTLLISHRQLLCPVLVQLMQAAASECPTGADMSSLPGPRVAGLPAALLRKEATYTAATVAAYELHDYVDWPSWLAGSLLPELSDTAPAARPLRRRVAAVVGAWVARAAADDRQPLYRALIACLSENDACLQLTVVGALRALIDDWNFVDAQFAEWVAPCVQLLLAMLKACTELDSHTAVFNLINLIIERMGDHIRQFVMPILQLMPQLWADAEGQSLVRIQVLLAMQRLVHILGAESPACYSLVVPAASLSIDVANPESLSLMEDGLALLLVLLRNAPDAEHGAPLLALAPALAVASAASTEHIRLVVAVLTSMVLLGGPAFVTAHAAPVCGVYVALLGNVNERGMLLMCPAMELCLGAAPSTAPAALQPSLLKLLSLVLSGRESEMVVANAMPVFARLLVISPQALMQLLADAAAQGVTPSGMGAAHAASATPADALLATLLDIWCEGFDSLASRRARKLCAVAMCRLLALPSPVVLPSLDALLVCITGVWSEMEGGADDGVRADYGLEYSWSLTDDGGLDVAVATAGEEAEGEAARRRALSDADPVASTAVSTALREGLAAAEAVQGQALHAQLGAVDATIAGQVQRAVSAPPPKVPST